MEAEMRANKMHKTKKNYRLKLKNKKKKKKIKEY